RRHLARRHAGQHLALLVHRRDRLVFLALPRAPAPAVAVRDRERADRLRRGPEGDPAPAALARPAGLHPHPPLERSAARRTFRRARRAARARGRDHSIPQRIAVASSSSAARAKRCMLASRSALPVSSVAASSTGPLTAKQAWPGASP